MEKLEKFLTKYSWLTLILLSVPAVWSLLAPGYFGVSDDLHIGWLFEMDRAVRMGQIPPRFVPDLSYGFGYPLFNFVFPLPFYLAEIFHLLGFSLVASIKAVFLLTIPASLYFMYKLLKEYASELVALAGAAIYIYAPYRATDIFVRGAVGEALAFAFLPLVFLSFVKLEKNRQWIGISALAIAALITSHNIVAYMFLPFLLAYLLGRVIAIKVNRSPIVGRYLAALILGLLAASYFWVPAIFESGLMQYSTVFNFADHFPTIKQLITPYFGYGASVPGPGDGMSFFVGTIGLSVVGIGLVSLLFQWRKFSQKELWLLVWSGATFLISILMMNYRSSFVWRSVPFLPYFQFPWRFLTLTTFIAPLFVIALAKLKPSQWVWGLVLILAVGLNFTYFKPEQFLGRQDEYYLNRYIPLPDASQEYKQTAEEYLRLPKGTEVRPDRNYPRAYADVRANLVVSEVNALDAVIQTDYPAEFVLNYNKYYFPGFVARIDGEPTELAAGKPFGQITLKIPAGSHRVEIEYRETTQRKTVNILSLGALLTAAGLVVRKKNEK
jgi:hypothetical protein